MGMKLKTASAALILFLSLAFSLRGASLEELSGPERAAKLRTGQILTEAQFKNPAFRLAPSHAGLRALFDKNREALSPGVMVEALVRYEKPKNAARPSWTEAERKALFNEVVALSSLEGIQYYSASRKTMRTFYESSRVIDGPESKRVLPDPFFSDPPALLSLYVRQKDLTFGDNIYRYDYRTGEDFLVLIQENLTSMNNGIIPVLGKNKLRSLVALIDAEDSFLVYFVSMAKATAIPGIKERVGASFTNRAEAVLKWITGRVDKAFSG
jgi:hypothetical protein